MISVKMKTSLKEAAQETAAEFGLPLSTIITAFLRQLVRQKELSLTLSEAPSAYLRAVIAESESGKEKSAKSLEEMFEKLDA